MKTYQITANNITYDIIEYPDGSKHWYLNDKYHRENGPAIENYNGDKVWYKNGQRHRDNGPAVEFAVGIKGWYKNGFLHRDNGPAVERINGKNDYWYNGKRLKNINSDEELIRYIKLLSIS